MIAKKNNNIIFGISFKLLNCLIFSVLSLLLLFCSNILPVTQILFIRVFVGAIISLCYLFAIKEKICFKLSFVDFYFYLSRAAISFVALYLWTYAISNVGLSEATALGYTGPLWVFLSAFYIIGEKFNLRSLLAILVNLIGIIIILEPTMESVTWQGVSASLGSTLLWVIYETICKKQTQDQHYMMQTFYVCLFASIIIAPFAFLEWVTVDLKIWGILFLVAALGVANVTSIFLAYFFAPMIIISPFSYARVIFTTIFTTWLNNTMPSIHVFIGSAIIVAINFYFAYQNTKNFHRK